jgi:hypothetical protein
MPDYKGIRWYMTPVLWLVIAHFTWMVSPYWMYYGVGPPKLEDIPQLVGVVRQEGEIRGRAGSWIAPRTYIDGDGASTKIHCSNRSEPDDCAVFWGLRTGRKVKVWYHWYFGVVFAEYIEPTKKPWADEVTYSFVVERYMRTSLTFVDWRDKAMFLISWGIYIYLIAGCVRQRRVAALSEE